MKNPKITVYIASHNYGRYLEDAIESVLRQTVDDWELLIINDDSSDNTADVMNYYKGDDRIRLFQSEGIGLPRVCNLALRNGTGEYIIRLDGDDVFDENILLVLSNWLDRHLECAMVFPDCYMIDEKGMIFSMERREKVYDRNHMLDMPSNGACCMTRRALLLSLGGYREDLGAQDGYDMWNKLLLGHQCNNVNIPLYYYRQHSNNMTKKRHHILNARRCLKIDATESHLDDKRPIIALIPCRTSYDFCPNLWSRTVCGKSLLAMDIEKCLKSKLFDKIVVACDNDAVLDTIRTYDDARLMYFKRKTEDTIRSRNLVRTIEPLMKQIDPKYTGITVISYLNAPFVSVETLEEAVSTIVLNNADSSMAVEEIEDSLFKRDSHGLVPINPLRGMITDFDVIYREANISMATMSRNTKTGTLRGKTIVHYTVTRDECFVVNSEQNLNIANLLVRGRE